MSIVTRPVYVDSVTIHYTDLTTRYQVLLFVTVHVRLTQPMKRAPTHLNVENVDNTSWPHQDSLLKMEIQ